MQIGEKKCHPAENFHKIDLTIPNQIIPAQSIGLQGTSGKNEGMDEIEFPA